MSEPHDTLGTLEYAAKAAAMQIHLLWSKNTTVDGIAETILANVRPVVDALADQWMEFINRERALCGLCGNTGIIDTRGIRSPAGVVTGVRGYCLCPNGRAMKDAATATPATDGGEEDQ